MSYKVKEKIGMVFYEEIIQLIKMREQGLITKTTAKEILSIVIQKQALLIKLLEEAKNKKISSKLLKEIIFFYNKYYKKEN
jgi:hypothetical protein